MQEDIPKQRGIYSEILTTEDTDNLKVSPEPAHSQVVHFKLPILEFHQILTVV